MRLVNRVHSLTRTPLDSRERLDQAWLDYQFCRAMKRLGCWNEAMEKIELKANKVISSTDWQS